jgi:hypothetical protein
LFSLSLSLNFSQFYKRRCTNNVSSIVSMLAKKSP